MHPTTVQMEISHDRPQLVADSVLAESLVCFDLLLFFAGVPLVDLLGVATAFTGVLSLVAAFRVLVLLLTGESVVIGRLGVVWKID